MRTSKQHNQDGYVLVVSLLTLLVLSIIGVITTQNTSIELQIAGNDKVHKTTFYKAEAGAIMGTEILEQSFNCPLGFTQDGTDTNGENYADITDTANFTIRQYERSPITGKEDLLLWNNDYPIAGDIGDTAKADIAYPVENFGANEDVGYLYVGGATSMLPGGALQMAAGYEGKGKAAGQGGVAKLFDLYSQFMGLVNSETIIQFGWRHLIGSEDPTCSY